MRMASSRAIARPRPEPLTRRPCRSGRRRGSIVGSTPGPSSRDDKARRPVLPLRCDRDRGSLRRVRQRVVEQDTHDLRHPVGVGHRLAAPSPWSSIGERVALGRRPELVRHPAARPRPGRPARSHLDRVGVELGEVEEIGGQLGQPRDLLAHRPDELRARGRVRLLLVEQLDEAAQREDRRAQLVRGVRDELPPRAVQPREALCISLRAAASWPTSSLPSSGIGVEKSPSASPRRPPPAA